MIVQLSKIVAKRVREIRLEKKLSQAALADRLGWPQPQLSDLETGKHEPKLPTIEAVAKALRVPVDTLFVG